MELSLREIAFYMRMGTHVPEGELAKRVETLRGEASGVWAPQFLARRFARPEIRFDSRDLDRRLEGCGGFVLVAATLGAAFDAWFRRTSIRSGVDALIGQAIGAAAIEKFVDQCEDEIRRRLRPGEGLVKRYSPGYGDFPLDANRAILSALDAARIGVSLTETLLLVPSKTVTAVIGVRPPQGGAESAGSRPSCGIMLPSQALSAWHGEDFKRKE